MVVDTEVLLEDMEAYENERNKMYTELPFHTVREFIKLVERFPRCIEFADASEIDLDKLISKEV